MNLPSLKERLEAKRIAQNLKEQSNNIIQDTNKAETSTVKLSLSEKIKLAQTAQGAIKKQIDTNIYANTQNTPKPLEMSITGISTVKNAIPALKPENVVENYHTTNPSQPKLSLSERIALAKKATEGIDLHNLNSGSMVEETPYDIKEEVSTNVKASVIKSLKDRIAAGKLTNITVDSNIPSTTMKETGSAIRFVNTPCDSLKTSIVAIRTNINVMLRTIPIDFTTLYLLIIVKIEITERVIIKTIKSTRTIFATLSSLIYGDEADKRSDKRRSANREESSNIRYRNEKIKMYGTKMAPTATRTPLSAKEEVVRE